VSALPGTLVGIVDDDPSVRKGLARLVKSAGYRVEVFASAHEFLTRPPREDPACLLIDIRMPGLTGLELQDALAIAGRRMSIVFVSGHGDVVGSVKAMKGGAVDFLTKPVDAASSWARSSGRWPRPSASSGNRREPSMCRVGSRP
jgi:FixJ family two-component response regulator